jgi:hypothetical protein
MWLKVVGQRDVSRAASSSEGSTFSSAAIVNRSTIGSKADPKTIAAPENPKSSVT